DPRFLYLSAAHREALRAGNRLLLVIDEAQNLNASVLETQVRVSSVAGSATVLRDNAPSCSGGRTTIRSTLSGPSRWNNVMGKLNDLAWPPGRPEQRQYRRFSVSYPVHVKFHFEDSVSELQAVTKDVSVGGLLIETVSPIPQHCPVD